MSSRRGLVSASLGEVAATAAAGETAARSVAVTSGAGWLGPVAEETGQSVRRLRTVPMQTR